MKRELLRIFIIHEKRCKSANPNVHSGCQTINDNKSLFRLIVMKLQNIKYKDKSYQKEKTYDLQRKTIILTIDLLLK